DTQDFDPWVAFDTKHAEVVVTFQSLGTAPGNCPPPGGQFVAVSRDGGLHWGDPIEASKNRNCGAEDSFFFGEGKVTTDNSPTSPYYGRTWLMGTVVRCKHRACSYPNGEIHSDDGGLTWTR